MTLLQNGDKIGPYTIREVAGQGGMATVYQAWHEGLHRFEALKVPRGAGGDPDNAYIQRLLAEARAAAGLQHPHIVGIHSVSEPLAPIPFFAMEWVQGRDLAQILVEKRTFSLFETVRILEPVADALDYAHSRGVVHRDIKPANILIEDKNGVLVPRVVDFGISRAAEDEDGATKLTKSGMIVGTPEYMSPEQAGSGAVVDHRTDLYSLAVVAYEMLWGGPPFTAGSGVSRLSILISHVRDTAPLFEKCPGFPPEAGRVLLSALSKSPAERPGSCREFLGQLKASAVEDFSLDGTRIGTPTERTPFDSSRFEIDDAATLCGRPALLDRPPTLSPARAEATAIETRSDATYSLRARLETAQTPHSTPTSSAAPIETPVETSVKESVVTPVVAVAEPVFPAAPVPHRPLLPLPVEPLLRAKKAPSRIPVLAGGAGLVVGAALVFVLLGRNSPSATTAQAMVPPAPTSAPISTPFPASVASEPPAAALPRLRTVRSTRREKVAFSTLTRRSSRRVLGTKTVEQRGEVGTREVVVAISYRGAQEIARRIESQRVTQPPVPEIIVIGSRQPQREMRVERPTEQSSEAAPVNSKPRVRRLRATQERSVRERPLKQRSAPRVATRMARPFQKPRARPSRPARSVVTRSQSVFRKPRAVREAPLPP